MKYTQIIFFILATVSGVLNYEGLTLMVAETDWWLKSLCALTGIAVTLSLSLFWNYAFATVPKLAPGSQRWRGWAAVIFGCILIINVSTYWNLTAFAKDEINRLSGGGIVVMAERVLAQAVEISTRFRNYAPLVVTFRDDIFAIQDAEITGGGTTGFSSAGPVSNFMGQLGDKVGSIAKSIESAEVALDSFQTEGDECLTALRAGIATGDNDGAGAALACINRVVAEMVGQNTSSTITRALETLTTGVTRPANVYSERSRNVIESFLRDTQARAQAIALQIEHSGPPVIEPLTMERPNVMRGVLVHWRSILPAIATALAVDLLPLVLLVFAVLLADHRRSNDLPSRDWSACELLEAVKQIEALKSWDDDTTRPAPAYIDLPPDNWQDDNDEERF